MADLVAGDVTYTLTLEDMAEHSHLGMEVIAQIAFGDGVDTYPNGGIPLQASKLGGNWEIISLEVIESNADGLKYTFDRSAQTLRIFEVDTTGDTDKALVELDQGSDTPAATTLQVRAIVR